MSAVKTHIVIVNYRTSALVLQAVESIVPQRSELAGGHVLLVDNCSADGSAEWLIAQVKSRGWAGWVHVLPQARNGGFSFGNNRGFEWLREHAELAGAHVLLLNPDAQLKADCLRQALEVLERSPTVGILGVPVYSQDGEREGSAHHWPTPLAELWSQSKLGVLARHWPQLDVTPQSQFDLSPEAHFSCDWVSGAFMLLRAGLLAQAGDMDEGFFLYFEEVDYCRRARALGWQVVVASASGIVHQEGASTGIQDPRKPRPPYWYASRRRYLKRHHGWVGLWSANLFSMTGRALFLPRKWLKLGAAGRNDVQPRLYHLRMWSSDIRALLRRDG